MDWIQLLALIGTMLGTVLGIVIPLHLHTLSHLRAIADEMKDFHGRMERQDAEFKSHMMYLHPDKSKSEG